MSKLTISGDGTGSGTKILLDGKEVHRCHGFTLRGTANSLVRLELDMDPSDLDIQVDAIVEVSR